MIKCFFRSSLIGLLISLSLCGLCSRTPSSSSYAHASPKLSISPNSPLLSPWAKRKALNVVVLAADRMSFLEAISKWNDHTFFPVLFQDDFYAPRFIAAWKPARIILLRSSGVSNKLDMSSLRWALYNSWSSHKISYSERNRASRDKLANLLHEIKIQPQGEVFTDDSSGETMGGLELAAGRFQPITDLKPQGIPEGVDTYQGIVQSVVSKQSVGMMNDAILAKLRGWNIGKLNDLGFVTLAGAYPYRYGDAKSGQVYALDDDLGRLTDGSRIAIVSRLIGSDAESAYQAACSLFLKPSSAYLFNTYSTAPGTIWNMYRLDYAKNAFSRWMKVIYDYDAFGTIAEFRDRTFPWNRFNVIIINSTGGATGWSARGGGGNTDDFPVGGPVAMHVTHSGSCANPYDPNTLAGRAIWGGAFLYFGSVAEPYLNAFQPSAVFAPRIAAGESWIRAFRRVKILGRPWRLMAIGDPQFCLRRKPVTKVDFKGTLISSKEINLYPREYGKRPIPKFISVAQWDNEMSRARWTGNHALALKLIDSFPMNREMDACGLDMAMEEELIASQPQKAIDLWNRAAPNVRSVYEANVYDKRANMALRLGSGGKK